MSVRKVHGGADALRAPGQAPGQARQAEGHHGGRSYKAGQERPQQAGRQAARKTPLTRRRPPRRGASALQDAESQDSQQQDLHDGGMDDQQRPFDPFAAMQKDAGSDSQGGNLHGQKRPFSALGKPPRKMQYKAAGASPGEDRLPRRLIQLGLPGAAELFGPEIGSRPGALDLVGAMASLVLAGVRQHCSANDESIKMSRLVLRAALAQSDRQHSMSCTLTLSDVKNLLILRQRQTWNGWTPPPSKPETVGDTLALLPLVVLNAARPRTPSQQRAAIDRQGLILRSRGV